MRFPYRVLGLLLCCFASVALAAGGGSSGGGSGSGSGGGGHFDGGIADTVLDPVVKAAKEKIAKEDWVGTQELLRTALQTSPGNPDYHNLLAFSTRKGPSPDMALVFAEYAEALRLDPKHRGAREYLGEAYLQVGDLPKAREQLAVLDKLCFFPCEEYSDLKKLVRQYETSHPQ
jgi:cytochrome c-type biogenesis protein CcmH/NrfG